MHTLWVNCRSRCCQPFRGMIGHSPSRIKSFISRARYAREVSRRHHSSVTANDGDTSCPLGPPGRYHPFWKEVVGQTHRRTSNLRAKITDIAALCLAREGHGELPGLDLELGRPRSNRSSLVSCPVWPARDREGPTANLRPAHIDAMAGLSRMPGTTRGDMVSTAPHIGYNSGK